MFGCSTNKAASVLNDAQTVHKLFNLALRKDFKTGKTNTVTTTRTKDIGNNLIILDEASMLDMSMLKHVDNYTPKAKVILVGDEYQLPPIGSSTVPAFSQGYPEAVLTEPMRQDKDSHVFKEISKLRQAVIEGTPYEVKAGEGITFLNGSAFKQAIKESFTRQEDARVLAYTNVQVEGYNKFIRSHLHGTSEFCEGDLVVAANSCDGTAKIEMTYRITSISEDEVTLDDGITYKIPKNKNAWFRLIKDAEREGSKSGDWKRYFALKDGFLDIRDAFACTVNKSQGSTYNKVFIDQQNLNTCFDKSTLLRLLYVANSRTQAEIIIYKG